MRSEYRGRSRPKVSRRQVLTIAASAGVGAAAVGVTGLSFATDGLVGGGGAGDGQPIVVHLRDAASGTLDIFVGEARIEVKDRDLAARLQKAAARKR
ncbi:hypothetical protein O7627_27925 [Solwaraspora sp. WMMD1047]|uniref:hypothetical protein n=1 Tax=Solwaraspora sp. WMMD1047 TaxID=3016102 RepID=UPI002415EE09|nr:hypothetical protein [Solwaraspora sp. WMMD1047]MDG4833106.1 hypothetical protein [Solwaraspora sp. WMMD1047]